jgi:hypothetical protein
MGVIGIFCLSVSSAAQHPRLNVSNLFTQLSQLSTTDRATRRILKAADNDSDVLREAAERLPGMIDNPTMDKIWLNAVLLAGKLKVADALPALQRAFDRGKQGIPANMTMGAEVSLGDDIVAKAFAEIGNPSLPAVKSFLQSADLKMRRRAILILRNIKSPASHALLQEQFRIETDPRNQFFIKNALALWND